MKNAVFGKTMENVRYHTCKTEARRNYLVSEPNYHTTIFFSNNLLTIEVKRTKILKNKPVCLGLSISEISKIT